MRFKLSTLLLLFSFFTYSQCWKVIESGDNFSHGIKEDGTLWAWGSGAHLNLGTGNNLDYNSPIQIGNANDWSKIESDRHVLSIKTNGTLWAWGTNTFGQLGDNSLVNRSSPVQIGNSNNWKKISCGQSFSVAIKNDGTLWAWGYNYYGQLANGSYQNEMVPTQIGNETDWKEISCGQGHVMALKENGSLWTWGRNDFGQLGNGIIDQSYGITTPTLVTNDVCISITAISLSSYAIKSDNSLWSWGQQNNIGFFNPSSNQSTPLLIDNVSAWKSIAGLSQQILALKTDNTLWGWGWNIYGVIGNNTTADEIIIGPIQIGNSNNWKEIRTSSFHSMALNNDGNLFTWGANYSGELGNNTNDNVYVPTLINCPSILNVDSFENSTFSFYPNPSKNKIFFSQEVQSLSLYDLNGRIIFDNKINTKEIDVSNLKSGIYILSITTENINKKFKLIRE